MEHPIKKDDLELPELPGFQETTMLVNKQFVVVSNIILEIIFCRSHLYFSVVWRVFSLSFFNFHWFSLLCSLVFTGFPLVFYWFSLASLCLPFVFYRVHFVFIGFCFHLLFHCFFVGFQSLWLSFSAVHWFSLVFLSCSLVFILLSCVSLVFTWIKNNLLQNWNYQQQNMSFFISGCGA